MRKTKNLIFMSKLKNDSKQKNKLTIVLLNSEIHKVILVVRE